MKKLSLLLLLQSVFVLAQVPQKMSYQSAVRNSTNQPVVNQNIGVKISISGAFGAVVYSETHSVSTNDNGVFSLEVGGGTALTGTFAAINWADGSHYIKSQIDLTGGTNYTLEVSKELLSVPYAFYANSAGGNAQNQITALQAQLSTVQAQLNYIIKKPTLVSAQVSNNTTSAVSGGNISSDGQGEVTARGVVWSTSPSPTIALATKTTNGTGTGEFTSSITGLSANTTYYVRAYATNSAGTAYGNEFPFITTLVSDIDGNAYQLAPICNQIWTKTNLNVSKYKNGDVIPQVTDPAVWGTLTTGAWCYYNNDPANGAVYGRLYNWAAVNDPRGLAPTGYHIPSETEWNALKNCLDPTGTYACFTCNTAGSQMKQTGTTLWKAPNSDATNTSGFTGLPGGYRGYGTTTYGFAENFVKIGEMGYWWSSTTAPTNTYAMSALVYQYPILSIGSG